MMEGKEVGFVTRAAKAWDSVPARVLGMGYVRREAGALGSVLQWARWHRDGDPVPDARHAKHLFKNSRPDNSSLALAPSCDAWISKQRVPKRQFVVFEKKDSTKESPSSWCRVPNWNCW